LFARYTLIGSLSAAVGALAAGIPPLLTAWSGFPLIDGLRAMFLLYGLLGGFVWLLYRSLPTASIHTGKRPAPLGPSRRIVFKLAILFSVDAFAGGLVVNSLLTLWLFERFGLSLAQAGTFFFCTGLLSATSQLAAPAIARRIGLLNTMVFTHIPANVCLILAAIASTIEVALALLFIRSALSQMDVPVRTAYVMAVVTPEERAAAASFTSVPRSLASAASPTLAGALLASGLLGAPLIVCGALKIAYDLALLVSFRRLNVPLDRE
jgi:predicted MFS family arabinose efflux permease